MKTIYAYKDTTSEAGSPEEYTINIADIVSSKCWFNSYGNPSYVFHLPYETTYLLVDDYAAMNGVTHISRDIVKRRKDMFNRFA